MTRDRITVVEAELSIVELARALRIAPGDAIEKFRDPRVVSWFAEIWGERLFGYKKHLSSNHPGSDAAIDLGSLGRFDISVRCFCRNTIKFQKSKFIGSGRSATGEDLIASLEAVERFVIVDLRRFPRLRFVPLDSKALLRLIRQGKLTVSGISPRRFDTWLNAMFEVTTVRTDLAGGVALPDEVPMARVRPQKEAVLF
ncbi:MAG TPA: hypothetical protein VME92_01395 [Acetobacteraceae bacterium]|nr:hypothetical protein [Acetobacteraceae bacterium]